MEPQLSTLTAIASVVALLCAMIVASGLRSRETQASETANRAEKAALYRQLLAAACRYKPPETAPGHAFEAKPMPLKQDLALWGSPAVIAAYAEFARQTRQAVAQADAIEALLHALVMAMRQDLGQSTAAIKPADLGLCLTETSNQQRANEGVNV